jgi:hypothetical protein
VFKAYLDLKDNALIVKIHKQIYQDKQEDLSQKISLIVLTVNIYCVTYINTLYHNREIFLSTMYTCILW